MAKRTFDLLSASIGLLVLWPVMLVVALLIRFKMGSPALFSAQRTGKDGRLFTIYKFRTMSDVPMESRTHHSGDDDPRVTGLGRRLRRFKLDELPQLWNVVRGDMSLVGPRPETPDYTKLYTPEQMEILSVRPGITDYASIEFSNLGEILSGGDPDRIYFEKVWDRKMELRLKYVREQSFLGDLKLILQTLARAVRG